MLLGWEPLIDCEPSCEDAVIYPAFLHTFYMNLKSNFYFRIKIMKNNYSKSNWKATSRTRKRKFVDVPIRNERIFSVNLPSMKSMLLICSSLLVTVNHVIWISVQPFIRENQTRSINSKWKHLEVRLTIKSGDQKFKLFFSNLFWSRKEVRYNVFQSPLIGWREKS